MIGGKLPIEVLAFKIPIHTNVWNTYTNPSNDLLSGLSWDEGRGWGEPSEGDRIPVWDTTQELGRKTLTH